MYEQTHGTSLLPYVMEAVLDTGLSLSYCDWVLNKLLPLFPLSTIEPKSPHIHTLTQLLVTLNTLLVLDEKLLAYQYAFDFVEGGARDFLEHFCNELPEVMNDHIFAPPT